MLSGRLNGVYPLLYLNLQLCSESFKCLLTAVPKYRARAVRAGSMRGLGQGA